jgi:prophage maintenance system killer protein
MVVFLDLNGWSFRAEEDEVVTAMVGLAAGGLSEAALASWLRDHSGKRRQR